MRGTYVDVEGALRSKVRQIFCRDSRTEKEESVLTDGVARILAFLS